MSEIYTTKAITHGGRNGEAALIDNPTKFKLALPRELGGAVNGASSGLNPEQLFAATYACCFEGAMMFVIGRDALKIKPTSTTAEITLLQREGGFTLKATITGIFTNTNQEEAMKLMELAHQVCPYSHVTRNNMAVTLQTKIENA